MMRQLLHEDAHLDVSVPPGARRWVAVVLSAETAMSTSIENEVI